MRFNVVSRWGHKFFYFMIYDECKTYGLWVWALGRQHLEKTYYNILTHTQKNTQKI